LVNNLNLNETADELVWSQNRFKENKTVFHLNLPNARRRFRLKLFANVSEHSNTFKNVCDFYAQVTAKKIVKSKENVSLSLNHVFYVEEPIEKNLVRNKNYTFRIYFKNVPEKPALSLTDSAVTNKWFYFVQDEKDPSLWTTKLTFDKQGEAKIVDDGVVLGDYKIV
jgi:hypothetical protein